MNGKPLIILTGPTAVGKTALSLALAKAIGGEIISADSMQVYRKMNIGSAKIMPEEMEGVPHHLVDCYDPEEEFHVVEFQRAAKEAMAGIFQRGHIPLVVGGTGFYIQALLRDIDFSQQESDATYRKELEELARREGDEALHALLQQVDPQAAKEIHPNNRKRVIRALEYYKESGQPLSAHNEEQRRRCSPYHFAYYVLTLPRDILYGRIDRRVDEMVALGLEEEVRLLRERGCHSRMVSMQGLGYKEMLAYLEGEITREEAIYQIKRDTRHFAKRQLTWFRREQDVTWLDKAQYDSQEALLAAILQDLRERGILPQG